MVRDRDPGGMLAQEAVGVRRLIAVVTLLGLLAGCGRVASRPVAAAAVVPAPRPSPLPVATPSAASMAALRPEPNQPIPILMYHVIGPVPVHDPLRGLYVDPALFAAQMAALQQAGYRPITLQQAWDVWQGKAPSPAHPIVLSFDDGYVGVFENAAPVLKAHGWPAVLNLQTNRLNIRGGLTDGQVRQMIADGWEVDDHTVTHPDLTRVSPQRLQAEIQNAAQIIRTRFGVPVRFFCYPAGRYNAAVIAAVRADGFLAATTVWPGDADPAVEGAWTLDRVRVSNGESPATLLAVLSQYAAEKKTLPPPAAYPPPLPRRPAAPVVTGKATPSAKPGAGSTATPTAHPTATSTATAAPH